MFGLLKSIFSTSESIEGVAKAAAKAGDALVFTTEERGAFLLEYAKATMPMNLARRLIALLVTAFWLFVGLIYLALVLLAGFTGSDTVAQLAGQVWQFYTWLNPTFGAVMVFYFGKGIIEKK